MKLLEERILKDGIVSGNVLKIDSFLNHQIDVNLISKCGEEWYELFKDEGITKILTIESSGIGIACITAQHFGVPVLFAKKTTSVNPGDDYHAVKVVSFTHGNAYKVIAAKQFLTSQDRVLIIDDFLANGTGIKALLDICALAGATVVGCGVAVEKAFQEGGFRIRERGVRLESLAKIKYMSNGKIEFC